jgi:hypothetical protein
MEKRATAHWRGYVGWGVLLAIPIVVFFTILGRTAVDLPILDDYPNVLGTADALSQAQGLAQRVAVVLHREHNGYKLMFENAVVWAQYALLGRVSILPLVRVGNALAVLIFVAVAAMLRRDTVRGVEWLALVLPAAFFLLQLQYASALNFASSSLQHLAVLAFALWSIYGLCRSERWAFVVACLATALSVGSSPNGFFLAPVGGVILLQRRQWRKLGCWVPFFAGLLGIYLYHYVAGVSSVHAADSTLRPSSHPVNAAYALSFLGSSAARYASVMPSLLLGSLLLGIWIWAAWRRYFLENPAVFYSMMFIVINAVAVSGLRPDVGVAQSLASRYRAYSNLMLAFTYIFLAESFFHAMTNRRRRALAWGTALAASILFCAISDFAGARFLAGKRQVLVANYRMQWQHARPEVKARSATESNPVLRHQEQDGAYDVNVPEMREAMRLGVYQPPEDP